MSVTDLLLKAMGGKRKNKGVGLMFSEKYMHTMGDKVVLQQVGANEDDIIVDFNKVCIRTSNMKDCFLMGRDDHIQQGAKCELASIDANGIHYVINDTWEPDIEACVADRILKSQDLKPSPVDKPAYVKLWVTGSLEIRTLNGEFNTLRSSEWTNLHNSKIEPGFWYEARIVWCDGLDKPAVVRIDWGMAPSLKYFIEQMAANTSDHLNGEHMLKDYTRTQYTVVEMNEHLMLNASEGEDLTLPSNRVLIKRSGWDQYFVYKAGDYIANGSACAYEGITNSGFHLLTNDTWDPGHNTIVANRIQRSAIMIPPYISEEVFVAKHVDGGISIINGDGEYTERPAGKYSMLSEEHLTNNVWYEAVMNWEDGHEDNGDFPLIAMNGPKIAPTIGAYLNKKGYEL